MRLFICSVNCLFFLTWDLITRDFIWDQRLINLFFTVYLWNYVSKCNYVSWKLQFEITWEVIAASLGMQMGKPRTGKGIFTSYVLKNNTKLGLHCCMNMWKSMKHSTCISSGMLACCPVFITMCDTPVVSYLDTAASLSGPVFGILSSNQYMSSKLGDCGKKISRIHWRHQWHYPWGLILASPGPCSYSLWRTAETLLKTLLIHLNMPRKIIKFQTIVLYSLSTAVWLDRDWAYRCKHWLFIQGWIFSVCCSIDQPCQPAYCG